jgi:hypothetical protein
MKTRQNEFSTWYEKHREDLLWGMFISCILEVLAMFAVMLFVTPYFETLNVFWYGFFFLFIPFYIFSEAAIALAKFREKSQAEHIKFSHIIASSISNQPIFHQWQVISIRALLLTLLPATACTLVYFYSSKSILVMFILALLTAVVVFIGSALVFERYAKAIVAGSFLQARSLKPLNESETVDFLVTYHLLPWLVFATCVFGLLMSKYYLGYVGEVGEVSLSSLATYSYVSFSFVGFWCYYNVSDSIQVDMKLQPMHLSGTDKFGYSELFGMICGFGFMCWLVFFAIGFFVPSISSGSWLTLIAIGIIIFAVIVGILASVLFAYHKIQPLALSSVNSSVKP